jgi:DNA-directed RNA polymerase specialized sigma24 family protein
MQSSVLEAGSGSYPLGQKIPTKHHPEGIDPEAMFFDELKVHRLILEYQCQQSAETWQAIVMGCLPLIDSLIRKYGFQRYEDAEALQHECVIKLFKAIRHYNPDRGRAFSCLTVAITRFLFSYVATIRTRTRRITLVADEILEHYEAPGQTCAELPAELKAKIQAIRTRFKGREERAAFKFLINYFLLEGFSCPRKLVLETLGRQFGFPPEKANTLYDYAVVSLRSLLHEFYTPIFTPEEVLKLCRQSSVLAEIHRVAGEKCFAKMMDIFAGVTVTFPSKSALEKLRKSQEYLNRLGDPETAFSPSSLGSNAENTLLSAVLEGDHLEAPLYAAEEG